MVLVLVAVIGGMFALCPAVALFKMGKYVEARKEVKTLLEVGKVAILANK